MIFNRDHTALRRDGGCGDIIEWRKGNRRIEKKNSFLVFLFAFHCIHGIANKGVCEIFIFFEREYEQKKLGKNVLKIFSLTSPIVFIELIQFVRVKIR